MSISEKEAANARALLRQHRQQRRKARPARIEHKAAKPGRERDAGFLSWLHEDLPCVACLILGPAPKDHAHIEAAHQKAQDAARGWHKLMGRRVHDRQACPLCAWHHRIGPLCCDPAQGKFWAVLGVDVVAFCEELFAAYLAEEPGAPVVRRYAAERCGSP